MLDQAVIDELLNIASEQDRWGFSHAIVYVKNENDRLAVQSAMTAAGHNSIVISSDDSHDTRRAKVDQWVFGRLNEPIPYLIAGDSMATGWSFHQITNLTILYMEYPHRVGVDAQYRGRLLRTPTPLEPVHIYERVVKL